MLGKDQVNRKELTAAVGELNRVGVIDKPINPVGKKTDALIRIFVETVDEIPENVPLPKNVVKMYNFLISDEVDEEMPDDDDIMEVDLNDVESDEDFEEDEEEEGGEEVMEDESEEEDEFDFDEDDEKESNEEEVKEETDEAEVEEMVEEEPKKKTVKGKKTKTKKTSKKTKKAKDVEEEQEKKVKKGNKQTKKGPSRKLVEEEFDPVMEYVKKTGNTKTPFGHRINSMAGMMDLLMLQGTYTKEDMVEKLCLAFGKKKSSVSARFNVHVSALRRDGYRVFKDNKMGGVWKVDDATKDALGLE